MELVKKIESSNILKKIILVVFGTLLLAISAKIKVPFYPVPMTMQTFVVVLIGITLGWKLGLITIFAYLFEGAIGLPVFAGTPEKGIGMGYVLGEQAIVGNTIYVKIRNKQIPATITSFPFYRAM